jgi:uracil-DNA glycosylase
MITSVHTPAPAFAHTCGPRDAPVVLVGEAFGSNEEILGVPLVGWSGQELARILHETGHVADPPPDTMGSTVDSLRLKAWWQQSGVLTTNVLAFRPPNNNWVHDTICGPKGEMPQGYALPPLQIGKYLRPEYHGELDRLREELAAAPRHLVVAMGAKATWAILRDTRIGAIRGAVTQGHPQGVAPSTKVLPVWHPANVLYDWRRRVVLVADMIKARREREYPEVRRPQRWVLVAPTLDEVRQWTARTLSVVKDWKLGLLPRCTLLSVDIETFQGQIESIAFARTRSEALVIPFIDRSLPPDRHDPMPQQGWSYWARQEDEVEAWKNVKALLESNIPKLFQNGLFDLQYLWRAGMRPRACIEDTMILHHALYPEMQKSLAFLGSVYSNEAPWKLMRGRRREDYKRDE